MADKLAVVFGGPSPEHDISILTGLLSERVLRDAGRDVAPLYWTRTGEWVLCPPRSEAKDFLEGAPKGATRLEAVLGSGFQTPKKGLGGGKPVTIDAALNCCHGGAGENGGVNALFDQLGIPLTGGPSTLAALGMDKLAFGAVLQGNGIPTLPRVALSSAEPPFGGPYIVKPRFGGSSIGIEVVEDLDTARALARSSVHLRQGVVLEPFVKGAVDLNLAYATHPSLRTSLLEKPLAPAAVEGIYSYGQKYLQTDGLVAAPRELPAQVPDTVTKEAERLAEAVLEVTGIKGVGRLDFLLVDGVLHVNEINTIPGSMSLYLWPKEVSAAELLLGAVEEARASFGRAEPAPFEPGAALRAAGGIGGKLGQLGQAR
ncbi:MAG: D-alanine--D-alanine ligase [Frankiales bacterium]|nr:D-alanine--D-alanine ligase [Frankiales bacterium]